MPFLIADGFVPSNEGRGYVLRKIMRRAMRHARLLGGNFYIFTNMAQRVISIMAGGAYEEDRYSFPYPELHFAVKQITEVIRSEETRFEHTLGIGLPKLEELITRQKKASLAKFLPDRADVKAVIGDPYAYWTARVHGMSQATVPGQEAFALYDTFGLPFDFIMEACRDQDLHFDTEGFERAMEEQRERARASWKGAAKQAAHPAFREQKPTEFLGYRRLEMSGCFVLAIIHDAHQVPELFPGQEGEIVLDRTPFYADSGGQVGDVGQLLSEYEDVVLAEVHGCYQPVRVIRSHRAVTTTRIIT